MLRSLSLIWTLAFPVLLLAIWGRYAGFLPNAVSSPLILMTGVMTLDWAASQRMLQIMMSSAPLEDEHRRAERIMSSLPFLGPRYLVVSVLMLALTVGRDRFQAEEWLLIPLLLAIAAYFIIVIRQSFRAIDIATQEVLDKRSWQRVQSLTVEDPDDFHMR